MDQNRFDTMTKTMADGSSRRGILKTLAAALLGGAALTGARSVSAQSCREPGRLCAQNGDCCSGECVNNRCGPLEACPANITCVGAAGPAGPPGQGGGGTTTIVKDTCGTVTGGFFVCVVDCPAGTRLSGGGARNEISAEILGSFPTANAQGWVAEGAANSITASISVFAVCV